MASESRPGKIEGLFRPYSCWGEHGKSQQHRGVSHASILHGAAHLTYVTYYFIVDCIE